jgi:hypothetical protein
MTYFAKILQMNIRLAKYISQAQGRPAALY